MSRYVFSAYFGHDSSVALVGEGRIVHLEVERFTRVKHDVSRPREEVVATYLPILLRLAGAHLDEVAAVVEAGCGDCLGAGRKSRSWDEDLVAWDRMPSCRFLGPEVPAYYLPHHLAHAAYAFYTSPAEEVCLVVMDGGGDSWIPPGMREEDNRVIAAAVGGASQAFGSPDASWRLRIADGVSVGGEWGARATNYCGTWFAAGTVMAMLGVPEERFEAECGLPAEERRHVAELQARTTEVFSRLAPRGESAVVGLAGGCALNGIAAYHLLMRDDVRVVHVPPAVHDGGLPVGCALFVLHAILREPRRQYSPETVAFAGYADADLDAATPVDEVADRLARGEVVAVAHGRAESGPRALGHRSILADPRDVHMKDRLNSTKGRRPFRPVAPVVLREAAGSFFELKNVDCYPFMTMIAAAKDEARARIPAGLHSDGTARVQVVDADSDVGRVVAAFRDRTGVPALLNTSFNLGGEAMVNNAQQALDTFARSSGIDAVAIGGRVVTR